MTIFNPSVVLKSDLSGAIWSLGTKDGKLAIVDKYRGVHILKQANNYTIIERTPVTTWLTGIMLDAWLQFAHSELGGGYNSGGLDVLEDIRDVLMSAGLIDENGAPRKALTLLAGAGGTVEEEGE